MEKIHLKSDVFFGSTLKGVREPRFSYFAPEKPLVWKHFVDKKQNITKTLNKFCIEQDFIVLR